MRIPFNFNDTRWKKPDVYFTSIGIYLVVSSIILISVFLFILSWGVARNFLLAIILGFSPLLLGLLVVSFTVSFKVLVRRKKIRYLSLVALIFWSLLILPLSMGLIGSTGLPNDSSRIWGYLGVVTPIIIPNAIMYVFLIRGWNSVPKNILGKDP